MMSLFLGRKPYSISAILLLCCLAFNSCTGIKPPPSGYVTVTFTFSNYLKNAYTTITGHTYVSYTVVYTAYYISNNASIPYDSKTVSMASSASAPQVVIISKVPSDNTPYQIKCIINATACSTTALTDDCIQTSDGSGGYYAAYPMWGYESDVTSGNSRQTSVSISNFVQRPNVPNSCGCDVHH